MSNVGMRSAVLATVLVLVLAVGAGTGTAGGGKTSTVQAACEKVGGTYSEPGPGWECDGILVHGPGYGAADKIAALCTSTPSLALGKGKPVFASVACPTF
jgi:hypothetical protein